MAIMLLADGLLFFTMSLLSATLPSIFPSALLAGFSGFMSVALEARFILNIYTVQEPERLEQQRAQAAAERARNPTLTRPATVITAAGADTLPLPVSANTQNVPIIIPSDQDIGAEIAQNTANGASAIPRPQTTTQRPLGSGGITDFGPIYGQFVLLLTIILLVSLSSTSWPLPLRTAYTHILSFTYLSFWLPQIKRNIVRNCRKALLWRFVISQSVLRLLPFAYFYLFEDNVMFAEKDWTSFIALVGWVWVQIVVLASQEVLGPRWMAPKGWYEVGWDYHPVLREDGMEAGGLPIGLVKGPSLSRSSTGEEERGTERQSDTGMREVDCAICMQVLEVPVVTAGRGDESSSSGGVTGVLARRLYMVTPCRHIFHSACLQGWMKFRLQCPNCRETLPPL